MPNWIRTELRFASKKDYDKAVKLTRNTYNEEGFFDFNKLIPMPKHQPDLDKPKPFFAKGNLGKEEEEKYGENNWYA